MFFLKILMGLRYVTLPCHLRSIYVNNLIANFLFALSGQNIQISIKECHNEDAQCAFIVDKILESASNCSTDKCSYGNIAILYRRQVKLAFHVIDTEKMLIRFHLKDHEIILYRCQGKYSKQPSVRGKYHSTFMVWPSIEKRS